MTRYRLTSTLLVVTLALSVQFCGGGSDSGPDTPTVPVPVPSATPEPPPVGEAPLSESCAALEPGVRQEEASCSSGPEHFLDEMNDAIDEVRARFPEYFGEGRNVVNVGAFYVEIIRALDRKGLCAETGGEEVGIKRTEAFNDQFDILTARSEYRNGDSIFLGSCSPAVIQVGQPIPTDGCGHEDRAALRDQTHEAVAKLRSLARQGVHASPEHLGGLRAAPEPVLPAR